MPAVAATAHDFSFSSIDGDNLPLSKFQGNVILLVNTASMCGFTGQYEGLQSLWAEYRDKGLVVIGVPSDDFGGQELDDA
ncbi:MAG: redoxin domain-containing protein, partial [Candidatus Puniceispirillaceae bacterium]